MFNINPIVDHRPIVTRVESKVYFQIILSFSKKKNEIYRANSCYRHRYGRKIVLQHFGKIVKNAPFLHSFVNICYFFFFSNTVQDNKTTYCLKRLCTHTHTGRGVLPGKDVLCTDKPFVRRQRRPRETRP